MACASVLNYSFQSNYIMKVYQTNEIKNIALLGNDGSGKTTLTEALLYESGIIKRRGRITAKNTVSDYFPVEQEYGYSVFSTVFHVEWNGKKLNIIDCPGSDDFVGAAITALNVTDTAILLLNGQYGVEVGTQNHFRYTEKLGKPVIFLVNQLDSEKCDYDMVLEQLKGIYGSKVVPVQYPLATGPNFNSLIDVLLMKKYSWGPEGGAPTIEEIPAEEKEIPGCRCAQVIRGVLRPAECPLFKKGCSPDNPVGPCMVSGEGACAAAYQYG